jgi:hypothetical protein
MPEFGNTFSPHHLAIWVNGDASRGHGNQVVSKQLSPTLHGVQSVEQRPLQEIPSKQPEGKQRRRGSFREELAFPGNMRASRSACTNFPSPSDPI